MPMHFTRLPCGMVASDTTRLSLVAFGAYVLPEAVDARQILTGTIHCTLLDSG
jgi:hypothetical protein